MHTHTCVCVSVRARACVRARAHTHAGRERREVTLVWNWATESSEREHHYFYQVIGLLVCTFSTNLYPFLGPLASSAEAHGCCSPQTSLSCRQWVGNLSLSTAMPEMMKKTKLPTSSPTGTHSNLIPAVFSRPPSLSLQKMPQICFFSSKTSF